MGKQVGPSKCAQRIFAFQESKKEEQKARCKWVCVWGRGEGVGVCVCGGKRSLGRPRSTGVGTGRRLTAFGETRERGEGPPTPAEPCAARTIRGLSPDDTQKPPRGSLGTAVILQREVRTVSESWVQLLSLCVYVRGGGRQGRGLFG